MISFDEPETLPYAIGSICPVGTDGQYGSARRGLVANVASDTSEVQPSSS